MMDQEKFTAVMLALSKVDRIGNSRLFKLSPKVVKMMEEGSLTSESISLEANEGAIVPRCGPDDISRWMDEAHSDMERWALEGIRINVANSTDYPDNLKIINQAPFFLYSKGDISTLGRQNVAIVGTRNPSDEGRRQAREIGRKLASISIGVVSGLALGCDTAGHEGALDGGGYTCAVLAHGLDMVAPARNRGLASRILENGGALISEHPPGVKPTGGSYVSRNRIQSGLSTHILVIEASPEGGTMHTARSAKDQGRSIGVLELSKGNTEPDFILGMEEINTQLGGVRLSNYSEVEGFVSTSSEEE